MNGALRRNVILEIAAACVVYAGAFYAAPRRWGESDFFGPPTWRQLCYNTVFYPMRRLTQTEIRQWDGWVERVDLKERKLLLMIRPDLGYFFPYRRRDAAVISELRRYDRIRVSVADLPDVRTDNNVWEFRGYVRLPGEEDGD